MKNFLSALLGGLVAVCLMAASNLYYGFNPSTGNNVIPGQWIDGGPPEIITSDNGCTFDTQHGGTNVGSFISRTSGPCHLTFSDASGSQSSGITGFTCIVIDMDAATYLAPFKQTANSANGCTVQGSTSTGDHLTFIMIGYSN